MLIDIAWENSEVLFLGHFGYPYCPPSWPNPLCMLCVCVCVWERERESVCVCGGVDPDHLIFLW